MTEKFRSTTITEGDSRSPNRSMLRAAPSDAEREFVRGQLARLKL